MTEGRRRLFISSTIDDLEDFRKEAALAGAAQGFIADRSEAWLPGTRQPPLEKCLERVRACDVVVAIVAERHGWEPEDQEVREDEQPKSITRLECEAAHGQGIEIIPFFVQSDGWPPEHCENHELTVKMARGEADAALFQRTQDRINRLRAFKQWLRGLGTCKEIASARELSDKLKLALQARQLPGEETRPGIPADYLRWLRDKCEGG